MNILSINQMKFAEQTANASAYTYAEMMRKAGKGIAGLINEQYYAQKQQTILGLIGKGNNGGDTLIALVDLARRGWRTIALLVENRSNNDQLVSEFVNAGGKVVLLSNIDTLNDFYSADVIVDGVFGTGFKPPLTGQVQEMFQKIRAKFRHSTWVAVDCPSGLDCTSGEVSPGTPRADLTICLEAVKDGLLVPDAVSMCGELACVNLDLRKFYLEKTNKNVEVLDRNSVGSLLPPRPATSNKGSYGKVLVVGGCANYPGATILAGRGAYAMGTGLVQVAVPETVYRASAGSNPEMTWLLLDDKSGVIAENASELLLKHVKKANCLVIGPGMGREDTTKRFLFNVVCGENIIEHTRNLGFAGMVKVKMETETMSLPATVIDADALFLLAGDQEWSSKLGKNVVLTPHPGEMAVLTGLTVEEIQEDRMSVATRYATKWGKVVVLKGALTIIAEPGGCVSLVPVANSALAKAGTGDVLAGMIGGLIAQGVGEYDAARAAAWIHAHAGTYAGLSIGVPESVMATDVIRAIPKIIAGFQGS